MKVIVVRAAWLDDGKSSVALECTECGPIGIATAGEESKDVSTHHLRGHFADTVIIEE